MNLSTWIMAFSAIVTTGATIALAWITSRYAQATDRYAKTADEMLKISNTPKIQVSLTSQMWSSEVWTIDFCVQNIGTGFAYDIKFSGDLSSLYPETGGGKSLAEYPIIENGISHLGPGKRYQIPIIWKSLKLNLPERTFNVNVTYGDSAGNRPTDKYLLDFNKYEGYTQIGDPSIDSLARSLSSIEKTLREMEQKQNNPNQ